MSNNKVSLKYLCIDDDWGKYGIPASAEEYDISKTRYLRITDISDDGELLDNDKKSVTANDIEKYLLKDGDIVFARTGNSTGRTYFHEENNGKLAFAGFLIKYALDKKKVNPKYLKFFTLSKEYKTWVKNLSVGSTRGNINAQTFANCPVTIPNRKQQDILVVTLSLLTDKIKLNNRINTELEAMAKTLYDYWFVQFDFPFNFAQGKPDKNGKPYKTSGGKMVWNEELKREIPEGWGVQKLADWIESDKSGDWGNDDPEGNYIQKVICIRGTDINSLNGLEVSTPPVRYILEKNSFKILNAHDLIIEISGGSPTQSTGRMAYITDATLKRFDSPLICSNFCKAISIKDNKMLYNFAYYWNSLYDNGVFFNHEGKTSGIKNLLFDSFVNSFYTVVPDGKIVEKFYNFMENIQNKKQVTLAENQKLAELRDWLLPMLMNGQVKVEDINEDALPIAAEPKAEYKTR